MKEQIQSFTLTLKKTFEWYAFEKTPKSWLEAFFLLTNCLDSYEKEGKKIVFLDELPWFSTHKSGFISALGWFWNSWATRRNNVILVICGSAASWMIQKIVKTKKQVFFTVISTFGIQSNEQSVGCIDNTFSMDILFEKL